MASFSVGIEEKLPSEVNKANCAILYNVHTSPSGIVMKMAMEAKNISIISRISYSRGGLLLIFVRPLCSEILRTTLIMCVYMGF